MKNKSTSIKSINNKINLHLRVKSCSTPPRGGAWERFFLWKRSRAERNPHYDGDPQPVSRSVSSSSLRTIPQHKNHEANNDQMIGSEPYSSSSGLLFFLFFTWSWRSSHSVSIQSIPSSHTVVVDWIKLASFVTVKEDTNRFTRLVWLWCLGSAWLELRVFWEFFPRT